MTRAILSDNPLEIPTDDVLGYAEFARNVADALCDAPGDESLVFALYGPWGSGKTTCLNFICHFINARPRASGLRVTRFNPWWFSGSNDLLGQFFRHLRGVLGRRGALVEAPRLLGELAAAVLELPEPTGLSKVAQHLVVRSKESVEEAHAVKQRLSRVLKKQKARFLVVIDDIDRLTGDEIRALFRLVRSVADLPKVQYLLAFDKSVVTQALRQDPSDGEDYLAKIVQVGIDLPEPDRGAMRKMFLGLLERVLAETPGELLDKIHFQNLLWVGIYHFLKTLRDVKRLVNVLTVDYPSVRGEVNPADFVALETIRVFLPSVYLAIRENPKMFCIEPAEGPQDKAAQDALAAFHRGLLDDVAAGDRSAIQALFERLFPGTEGLGTVFGTVSYDPESEREWKNNLRVCSQDVFPTYFRLGVPAGRVSNAEVQSILALAQNYRQLADALPAFTQQRNTDGITRASALLEKLWDFAESKIPQSCVPAIIAALLDVGDLLDVPEDEPRGLLGYGNDVRLIRVVFALLKRLQTSEERYHILRDAVEQGRALSTAVRVLAAIKPGDAGSEPARQSANESLIDADALSGLRALAVEKIKDSVRSRKVLETPRLLRVLHRWRDWETEDAPKQYIRESDLLGSDKHLADFLAGCLGKVYSQARGDHAATVKWRLDPRDLAPFVDVSEVVSRCRSLIAACPEWLTGRRRTAVSLVVRAADAIARGDDPDDEWEEE